MQSVLSVIIRLTNHAIRVLISKVSRPKTLLENNLLTLLLTEASHIFNSSLDKAVPDLIHKFRGFKFQGMKEILELHFFKNVYAILNVHVLLQ